MTKYIKFLHLERLWGWRLPLQERGYAFRKQILERGKPEPNHLSTHICITFSPWPESPRAEEWRSAGCQCGKGSLAVGERPQGAGGHWGSTWPSSQTCWSLVLVSRDLGKGDKRIEEVIKNQYSEFRCVKFWMIGQCQLRAWASL